MRHLGHIWALSWPTWRHLGPNLAHLGAKMCSNRPPEGAPSTSQSAPWGILAPGGSPRASKPPRDLNCFKFLLAFCYRFCQKLLRMFWKTFVLFSLFPFHAKPGLTRPPPKTRPRRGQDDGKMRILAHLRHLCRNILPRSSQLEAKIGQDGPTWRQDGPT